MNADPRPYVSTASACAVLLTACGLLNAGHAPPQQPAAARAMAASVHIAQVGFGPEPLFARCIEPACPSVTPKSFAATPAGLAPSPVATIPSPEGAAASARTAPLAAVGMTKAVAIAAPRKVVMRFGTNSALLTAAHKAVLSNALDELRRTDRIVILGRTDDLGSEPLNQALALARALAIRDHLLDLVPDLPARISIDARGRCCYATPNDSGAGRALNRRVELLYALRDEGAP